MREEGGGPSPPAPHPYSLSPMFSVLAVLAQSLGIAYTTGINLYATVAVLGIAERMGWIGPLPGALGVVGSPWIIGLAALLYAFEFLATLVPGVASAWETLHTAIRPPAAALLAAAATWGGSPALVLGAALLGGSIGLATHATKLGVRYAIDTSPEPVTNGLANLTELGVVTTVAVAIWLHPLVALAAAILFLVVLLLLLRTLGRLLGRTVRRVAGA